MGGKFERIGREKKAGGTDEREKTIEREVNLSVWEEKRRPVVRTKEGKLTSGR